MLEKTWRSLLLGKSPAFVLAKIMERGMLLDQQVPDLADLLGPEFPLGEADALRQFTRRRDQAALRIGLEEGVIEIVEQDPAAAAQQLLDQEEGEAVGLPAMPAVDVTEIEARCGRALNEIQQPPVVGNLLVVDRHVALEVEALQQLFDVRRIGPGRQPIDRREVAAAVLFQDRRHVGAADAVMEAEFEAVPD